MRKLILSLAATPLILGSIAVSAQAADDVATGAAAPADAGFNILSDVKFKGELRTRYQYLDIDALSSRKVNSLDPASIVTNRTNLNFSAKLFELEGLNAEMELNAVNDFGSQYVDGTQIDKHIPAATRPSNKAGEVAVAKISQANISYTNSGATGLVGRKTVNIDNQRWVGSVGWKQNFQTLDLALLAYGTEDKAFNIMAAYVYGVNAIGDDGYDYGQEQVYNGVVGSGSTRSGVLHASYKIMDPITITGYGYLLGSVSDTYGAAATGKIPLAEGMSMTYRAEYALQTKASLTHSQLQAKSKTSKVSSQYINVDVGANLSGVLLGANYEVLGANKDYDRKTNSGLPALQTHLATKHKFNGWADQFLKTPDGGLQDINARIGYKSKSAGKVLAVYHMFSATQDMNNKDNATDAATNLGSEIDLLYTRAIPSVTGLSGLIKAAMYSAGDVAGYGSDKTMVWAQLDYKFATK